MTIHDCTNETLPFLLDMTVPYMIELDSGSQETVIREKLLPFIRKQFEAGIIRVSYAMEGETPAGFSVFQIDSPESDWCKRPGWGFIREFYVVPAFRKMGVGKRLAEYTEQELRTMGAEQLYLTSTEAVPFWQRCGWRLTDTLCSNGQYILEK